MLAIKKHARESGLGLVVSALICLLALAGCTPPGPRALLDGDRLIRDGKYSKAIERLEVARGYMERDPRVYHWLGLAYQGAGDVPHAVGAYRQALALDALGRSNLVFVAHYNLGCLYLDQGNLTEAISELRSYCSLSNSSPALLKLGQAELRARQFDAAERTLGNALRWQANDPAVLNALGLVNVQRGHTREAGQFFQAAQRADPQYAPAVLNLAVLYHHQPAQRAYAAQKYREYLALQPRSANAEAVKASLAQLEQELGPSHPPATNAAPAALAKTNTAPLATNPPVIAQTRTNPAPASSNLAVVATNLARPLTNLATLRTSPPPAVVTQQVVAPAPPSVVRTATSPPPAIVSSLVTTQVVQAPPPPRVVKTNLATALQPSAPTRPSTLVTSTPAVTVVKLPEPAPIKPAQDATGPTAPAPLVATPPPTNGLYVIKATPQKPPKKSFFQKLNPFPTKSQRKPEPATATLNTPAPKTTNAPVELAPAVSGVSNAEPAAAAAVPTAAVEFALYTYLSPPKPVAGDRNAAAPYFAQGLKAHQQKQVVAALKAYRAALVRDPAYYEAWYNISLIALQMSDWKAALDASETALAINPDGVNARLTLGQALDGANYPVDAAKELEKVIQAKPGEPRAHFALANLYAQKLGDPARARLHYRKVLELDPSHPRSTEIRYWLAANP